MIANVALYLCLQVPVPSSTTALPKTSESLGQFLNRDTRPTVEVIHETDELQKARLAWIMGRRGNGSAIDEFMVALGNQFSDTEFGAISQGYGLDRQFNWDNGKGVNRHSRLCSTEYLGRIFEVAMRRVHIQLSLPYDDVAMGGQEGTGRGANGKRFFPNYKGGTLGTVTRPMKKEGTATLKHANPLAPAGGVFLLADDNPSDEAQLLAYAAAIDFDCSGYIDPNTNHVLANRKVNFKRDLAAHPITTRAERIVAGGDNCAHYMQTPLLQTASMTLTNNITFDNGTADFHPVGQRSAGFESQAVRSRDNRNMAGGVLTAPVPDRNFKCGIYARPLSPFLHGRTLLTGMSATLVESEKNYPRRMADAMGDHVAFAALEQAMTRVGLLDWRPDGVVNSKLENGPDKLADAEYDMKDGMLYNVHVQGPAICSNWCGTEHSRSVVAGDKLFVAIVADSWVNCGTKDTTAGSNPHAHLPASLQKVYASNVHSAQHAPSPTASSSDLAAAGKVRAEILKSFAKNPRVGPAPAGAQALAAFNSMNNSGRELLYSKLFGLHEMRTEGTSAKDLSGDRVNPHLLCNFRLKYLTSSEMIETSKLQLNDKGGVAMRNGMWPAGSRCGLAFSRCQIRANQTYDPQLDAWLDLDASTAQWAGQPGIMALACAAYEKNPVAAQKLIDDYPGAGNAQAQRAMLTAFGDDEAAAALTAVGIRAAMRGPPVGAAVHEVIVGAWHIGTVLDTAASRGSGRGFASHSYDSAVNLNVSIEWWSGDRLYKNFANKPGTGQDFRMRSMPAPGYTTNQNVSAPAAIDSMPDTGPGGSSVLVNKTVASLTKNSIVDAYSNETEDGDVAYLDGPGGLAGIADEELQGDNDLPLWAAGRPLDIGEVNEEAKRIMDARTSFPDPWDLPVAAPMLPINGSDSSARSDFASVGKQRGVWAHPEIYTRQGRRHVHTLASVDAGLPAPFGGPEFVHNATANAPANEVGYVRSLGRIAIADPGNKLATMGGVGDGLAAMEGTNFASSPADGAGQEQFLQWQGDIVTFDVFPAREDPLPAALPP